MCPMLANYFRYACRDVSLDFWEGLRTLMTLRMVAKAFHGDVYFIMDLQRQLKGFSLVFSTK